MKRRVRAAMVTATALLLLFVSASAAFAEKKIGILVWETQGNYTAAKDAIIEQLGKEGFGPSNATFMIENAEGNKAKAAEIARKFAASKLDLIVPLGTSAAVPVVAEIKDVPVVFSVVYDPVDSKIAADWKSSGNNTTGTSTKVHMSQLLENLKKLAPVKSLAVLYTPGQKNSEAQLKDLQAAQAEFGIKIVPVPLTQKEDAVNMLEQVAGRVDSVFLSGSSIAVDALPVILEVTKKAGLITASIQSDKVEKGILFGVYANTRDLGIVAGKQAAKVLRGAKPSAIPIETVKKADVIINMKTAKESRINIPPDFVKTASRVVE
jgi:putative tryptophan/tyrosine transport system substrate-binding protein